VRCDESAVRRKTSVIEGGEKRREIGSWVGKIRSAESIVHILYQSLSFPFLVFSLPLDLVRRKPRASIT